MISPHPTSTTPLYDSAVGRGVAPQVTGLLLHTSRARAQTKTFHSPRPHRTLSPKGEETRVPLEPSHVEKKTKAARGHPRKRTRLWPGGLGGKRGAGRRLFQAPRWCAGAVARLGTLFSAERPKGGAGDWVRTRDASFPVLFCWVARVGFGRRRSRSSTPANRHSGLYRYRVASSSPRSHTLSNAAPGRPRRAHEPVFGPQRLHGPLRCPPLNASGAVSAAAAASPVPGRRRRRRVPGGRPGFARHAASTAAAAFGHGSGRDSGRSGSDSAAAPLGHCLCQDGAGEQVPARTHGREGLPRSVLHSRHAVADGR